MLNSLSVSEFLDAQGVTVVDVRSEGEFAEAHVPGAVNIPLLDNLERAEVGTLYKRQGPDVARRRGLEIVRPKLSGFFEALAGALRTARAGVTLQAPDASVFEKLFERITRQVLIENFGAVDSPDLPTEPEIRGPLDPFLSQSDAKPPRVIFYCWRGGARSKAMTLFAHSLGFDSAYIKGGHKAYRAAALEFLNADKYPFRLCTLYGLTGSAKTHILNQWMSEEKPVIDLENLAYHRGSAFGQVGIDEIGRQKDFENKLFWEMRRLAKAGHRVVVVEGESRRIGRCQLPEVFMKAMLAGIRVKVDRTVDERVNHILEQYVNPIPEDRWRREAERSLDAIKKRLGGEKHKELLSVLQAGDYREFTRILLVDYYDKTYALSREPDAFYHAVIRDASGWAALEKLFT
jgi:tRNA 2-selenouridine synthase